MDRFAQNQGWAMFEQLRKSDPVHFTKEENSGSGFWSVLRHGDIVRVDRDPETFISGDFVNLEEVDDDLKDIRRSMLETDGLRHRALRKLLQRDFGAVSLRVYEDFLRGLTKETLDRALAEPTFDFVEAVSADFPIRVLARMLDVPDGDIDQLIAWGNRMIGNTDPEYADVLLEDSASDKYRHLPFRSPAALEVFEYGRRLRDLRKGKQGDDLVSKLANRTPEDGVELDQKDFDNYFLLLVVAGNETTRHTISHSMAALIENWDQFEILQSNPALIPHAVEEFLRYASPVYHFRRTAAIDTVIGDREIKAGQKVVMWFASGNRDEEVFDDPNRFDVTREKIDHVAFGKGGPHFCLGNNLARMEIRIMFEELIPRLKAAKLAGPIRRVRSNFVNGIKELPITVQLR
ncbi:MAG: cytochrome P450 [Actinomycetota bacterium]|nr:cytochrome P450 [Actinomycetota bacterium]